MIKTPPPWTLVDLLPPLKPVLGQGAPKEFMAALSRPSWVVILDMIKLVVNLVLKSVSSGTFLLFIVCFREVMAQTRRYYICWRVIEGLAGVDANYYWYSYSYVYISYRYCHYYHIIISIIIIIDSIFVILMLLHGSLSLRMRLHLLLPVSGFSFSGYGSNGLV